MYSNFLLGQEEAKLKNIQELFAEVREQVAAYRDEQDKIAIQKAKAAIAYAVSSSLIHEIPRPY